MQLDKKRIASDCNLAVNGGKPIRDTWLPYGRQTISQADVEKVVSTLTSDYLTQGPVIPEFESLVADYVGVKFAVAISNGTAALHAAYHALGISKGDLIITSPMTFAATSNAAVYLGARPLFADVEPSTGLIEIESIRKLLSRPERKSIKAIVAIDFAGQPCRYRELEELASEAGVPLVIDAAHSLGSRYAGNKGGFAGALSTFSFHPVKSITTGEGGMVLTNDRKLYESVVLFRSHGIQKGRDRLLKDEGPWWHEMQELGFNYRMTEIQAALGLSQMASLDSFVERRAEIAATYRQKLAENQYYECLDLLPESASAHHLFPILVKKQPFAENRKLVFEALHAENIGVQVHYIPTYKMPFYQELLNENWQQQCPNTEEFYAREISLPIFPAMSDFDIDNVVAALNKIGKAFWN